MVTNLPARASRPALPFLLVIEKKAESIFSSGHEGYGFFFFAASAAEGIEHVCDTDKFSFLTCGS